MRRCQEFDIICYAILIHIYNILSLVICNYKIRALLDPVMPVGWMDGWVYVWIDGCMGVFTERWIDGSMLNMISWIGLVLYICPDAL